MSSSYLSNGRDDSLYQQCFKPVENIEGYSQEDEINPSSGSSALAENNLLKNEIRCLNNDLALMLQRCKTAEKGKVCFCFKKGICYVLLEKCVTLFVFSP